MVARPPGPAEIYGIYGDIRGYTGIYGIYGIYRDIQGYTGIYGVWDIRDIRDIRDIHGGYTEIYGIYGIYGDIRGIRDRPPPAAMWAAGQAGLMVASPPQPP